MTRRTLFAAVAAGWLLAPPAAGQVADQHDTESVPVPAVPDASGKRPDLRRAAERIVARTNAFRKEQGCKPVAVSKELAAAAESFAGFMARADEYGHTADDRRPAERATAHGYAYCIVLENIAYAFDSRGFDTDPLADQFVAGWEKSPGHRRNMLDPDVTDTGVAVARSEKTGHYYAVQMFGRPKSAAIRFEVANQAGAAVEYTVGGQTFALPPRTIRTHTRCRPAELTFRWPGDGAKPTTLTPAAGDKLVVRRGGDGFGVDKE